MNVAFVCGAGLLSGSGIDLRRGLALGHATAPFRLPEMRVCLCPGASSVFSPKKIFDFAVSGLGIQGVA